MQYNVAYLQDFVKYVGINPPFNKMIPLVELPMQTCLDRGCRGQTTGYVSPGVIWIGHYFQAGLELQVQINHRTGHSVGILFGRSTCTWMISHRTASVRRCSTD